MKIMTVLIVGLIGALLAAGVIAARALANPPTPTVHEGEAAIDFTLPDQDGRPVKLSDQRGKWVVLYFYPKDDTPGCTKEACSFRDNLAALQQINARVLGVSVDTVESHKKFSEKFKLTFPILADDRHEVSSRYGVLQSIMGFKVAGRSTVIIDPDGVIRRIFPSVQPTDHALEVHRALKTLQQN